MSDIVKTLQLSTEGVSRRWEEGVTKSKPPMHSPTAAPQIIGGGHLGSRPQFGLFI